MKPASKLQTLLEKNPFVMYESVLGSLLLLETIME